MAQSDERCIWYQASCWCGRQMIIHVGVVDRCEACNIRLVQNQKSLVNCAILKIKIHGTVVKNIPDELHNHIWLCSNTAFTVYKKYFC